MDFPPCASSARDAVFLQLCPTVVTTNALISNGDAQCDEQVMITPGTAGPL